MIIFAMFFIFSVSHARADLTSSEISQKIQREQDEIRNIQTEMTQLDQSINKVRRNQEQNRFVLAEATTRLREAEERFNSTLKLYEDRLTAIYKMGKDSYYAIILSSENLTDAMGRMEYLSLISENDSRLVNKVKSESQNVRKLHDDIDELKQGNTEDIRGMVLQKQELQSRIDAVQSGIKTDSAELVMAQAREQDEESRRLAMEAESARYLPGVSVLVSGQPPEGLRPTGVVLAGSSSWYGPGFHGNRTANGETYNMYAYTAAHKSLPFGTWLKVTCNGRSVFVRINDRGPYVGARILDLSKASADAIGLSGVAFVTAEIYR